MEIHGLRTGGVNYNPNVSGTSRGSGQVSRLTATKQLTATMPYKSSPAIGHSPELPEGFRPVEMLAVMRVLPE